MTNRPPGLRLVLSVAMLGACAAPEENVRPGINKEYKDPDISKWVERFESESREVFHEREKIAHAAGVREGMVVADIGAGTGIYTWLFSQMVGASGHVYAEDIKPEFLQKIGADAEAADPRNITTILGTDHSAKLPANRADLAFVCDTYHHFEYPRSMLASIHQALKPDGILVVIDFDRVPGKSREWVLDHVRAGRDEVIREIEGSGFQFIDQPATPFLTENYLIRFRKSERDP